MFLSPSCTTPTIASWDLRAFLPRCRECRRGLAMRIMSVCLSNACIVTKQKKDMSRFLYHERSFSLVFWEEWMVGANPSTWNFGSTGPRCTVKKVQGKSPEWRLIIQAKQWRDNFRDIPWIIEGSASPWSIQNKFILIRQAILDAYPWSNQNEFTLIWAHEQSGNTYQ